MPRMHIVYVLSIKAATGQLNIWCLIIGVYNFKKAKLLFFNAIFYDYYKNCDLLKERKSYNFGRSVEWLKWKFGGVYTNKTFPIFLRIIRFTLVIALRWMTETESHIIYIQMHISAIAFHSLVAIGWLITAFSRFGDTIFLCDGSRVYVVNQNNNE